MNSNPTLNDLDILVRTLAMAISNGLIERDHAKGVFKKVLDLSGFNTTRPIKKADSVMTVVEETIEYSNERLLPKK